MKFKDLDRKSKEFEGCMMRLYGEKKLSEGIKRYENIAEKYVTIFGDKDFELFSAPGRTEIIGNHTDHNHGKVLAGSIDMDCIAAAGLNDSSKVRVISETYSQNIEIDVDKIPESYEVQGTEALISGILKGFLSNGYEIGGVDIYSSSNVIGAAGVSSSASFEMMVCRIMDYFFNGNKLNPSIYSLIGKYAENTYWNKSSGLLDQMACAAGGVVALDFCMESAPVIKKAEIDFEKYGYSLLIVNTGKNHADLSVEYSSIPSDMKKEILMPF